MGPWVDRYGRKPLLLLGTLLFAVTSALAVLVTSLEVFVALRLFQAVGSCAGMIVARAVVGDLHEEREAARFFSLLMVVTVVAPIVAPTLGGFLAALAGWQAIFVFLAAFASICLLLAWSCLPETLPASAGRRLDLREAFRTYALLLATRRFLLPTLVCAVAYGELFAFISGSPHVYMDLHGVSQQQYGLLFGVNAVGMMLAAKLNHTLLERVSPSRALWGYAAFNTCCAVALFLSASYLPLPALVAVVLLCLVCVPGLGANATALAMASCADVRGSASALLGVLQFGVASLASAGVALLHDGTVHPMSGMILGCSVLVLFLLVVDLRTAPAEAPYAGRGT